MAASKATRNYSPKARGLKYKRQKFGISGVSGPSGEQQPMQKLNMGLLPTAKSLYIFGDVMFGKAGSILMCQARADMEFFIFPFLEIGLVLESQ